MNSVSNSVIDGLRNNPSTATNNAANNNGALEQSDFFALLTQQLSYQDPTKPVENDQMISQMTSFSMADGITGLNKSFENFAASMTSNQALQASSLVGQKVLVPGNEVSKNGEEGVSGVFALPVSGQNMQLRVEDKAGQLIKTVDLGSFPPGKYRFEWDGTDNNGNAAPMGEYSLSVSGQVGNKSESLPLSTYAHVQSVSLGANGSGITINTNNGAIKLSDVEEIGEG